MYTARPASRVFNMILSEVDNGYVNAAMMTDVLR